MKSAFGIPRSFDSSVTVLGGATVVMVPSYARRSAGRRARGENSRFKGDLHARTSLGHVDLIRLSAPPTRSSSSEAAWTAASYR